jgi:hypothetical protein
MLMKDDKKHSVSVIMGKLMGDKKEGEMEKAPTKEGVEQDDSVATDVAAEELLQAIEQKSPKGIVAAIKSLIELCSEEYDEQPEQE